MSFQPILPMGGFVGWSFLQRTMDTQLEAHARAPDRVRDIDHFRDRIADVRTVDELVEDRRMRRVMLGAFGLQDDIDNIHFIKRVIGDGTEARDALANRLSDKRYLALAEAFSFPPDVETPFADPDFADRIADAFQRRSFEVAVGQQNEDMRLAMTLERELPELAAAGRSDSANWFSVMGNPPLRKVFETAFGFGSGFGALDIDQQLVQFRRRAQALFGTSELADLAAPERREELTRRFLVMAQAREFAQASSSASTALTLLQNAAARR